MSGYLAFAYLLLGATIASYAFYLAGLKIVGPTKASLISCAEPLASIISVVLLLNTELAGADISVWRALFSQFYYFHCLKNKHFS